MGTFARGRLVWLVTVASMAWLGACRPGRGAQAPVPAPTSAPSAQDGFAYVGFWPQELDLGRVPWHVAVPFAVNFVNFGSRPVTIESFRTSCGCTTVDDWKYEDVVVPPGEVLPITGAVDVGGLAGAQRRKITLRLETGETYSAVISYDASGQYAVKPESLDFGQVRLDEPPTEESNPRAVVVFLSRTARLTGVGGSDVPWLEVKPGARNGQQTEIVVTLIARYLPHGRNFTRLRLNTDDGTRPVSWLPVRAEGIAELRAVPRHVRLPLGRETSVHFLDAAGNRVRPVSVEPERPEVLAARSADGEEVNVRVVRAVPVPVVVRVETEEGMTWFLVTAVGGESRPD